MIDDNRAYEILSEICESVSHKRSKRGFIARCPVCGDSQKSRKIRRLHVDWYTKHNDFAITCYNGGCSFRSGNIYSLYATVKGVSFKEAKKYIDEDVYDSEKIVRNLSGSKAPEEVVEEKSTELDLNLDDCIWDTRAVGLDKIDKRYQDALKAFINDRLIPEEYAEHMMIAKSGRYKGRVIVPVVQNGDIVYFQGRSIFDNITPKYLNPEVDKELIISNVDKFNRDKWIIVTEGLIDSWMVEYNQGTPVLGGYFNDRLMDILFLYTDKGVIIVPDNPTKDDAGRKELLRYMEEGKYSNKVHYFLMPNNNLKDLNDLRIDQPEINMYNYIVENKVGKFACKMQVNLSGW